MAEAPAEVSGEFSQKVTGNPSLLSKGVDGREVSTLEDWKEKIKASLDSHNKRRTDITRTLNSLFSELEVSPYNIGAGIVATNEYPLSWTINIEGKKFEITELEILNKENFTDGWDTPTGEKRDLKEVLKELLVEKFTR